MRVLSVLILATVLQPAAVVRASDEESPLPPHIQVGLLLKALTFERNLVGRSGEDLTIGVVYVPGDPASVRAKDGVSETLKEASSKTVKKLRIRYVLLEYTSPAELERAVKANHVGVIYVTPGNSGHLEAVLKVSQAQRVITITGVPDYVKRGVALGVGRKDDKNEVLINLRAARSEGSEFDSRLLRVATVL